MYTYIKSPHAAFAPNLSRATQYGVSCHLFQRYRLKNVEPEELRSHSVCCTTVRHTALHHIPLLYFTLRFIFLMHYIKQHKKHILQIVHVLRSLHWGRSLPQSNPLLGGSDRPQDGGHCLDEDADQGHGG